MVEIWRKIICFVSKSRKKKNFPKSNQNYFIRGKEKSEEKEINKELLNFYETLFQQKGNVPRNLIYEYLHQIEIPNLPVEYAQTCERMITENEMGLRKMLKNKAPRKDGITKEFYETFSKESEAVVRRCSSKQLFLKTSLISLENTCVEVLF